MGRLLLRERIKYLYLRSQRQCLGRYPVVCRSWRKSTLRNMFLFLFHYLEKVSSLSCGPVEIYDRSRYQQWRYDCDPEAEYSFGWRHCCTLNTICSELEKENPQKNLLKTTIRSLDSFLSIANGKVIIYKYSRWYFTVFLGCSDPYSYSSCFL